MHKNLKSTPVSFQQVKGLHIRDAQKMMKRIYFERDKRRGIDAMCKWLSDEVRELEEAITHEDINAIREEMADVLAWLLSLANVIGVELEDVFLKRYPNRCPKCGQSVCNCQFYRYPSEKR